MPTIRQERAANLLAKYNKEGKKITKRKLLLEAGYSPKIANNPAMVFDSKGFKEYLAKLDDTKIIDRWYDWAISGKDKRIAVKCGEEILKLKDRYPAQKSKVLGLFHAISQLEEKK